MIIAIIGAMGSGKTLLMTYKAIETYQAGNKIYSNYKLEIPHYKLDFKEMYEMKQEFFNTTILLDEAHVFLDSRESQSKKNVVVSRFLTQTRKMSVTLIYSSQTIMQCEKRLRQNSDFFYFPKLYRIEDRFIIKANIISRTGKKIIRVFDATEATKTYNTNELIFST